jgi:hypothetical protein
VWFSRILEGDEVREGGALGGGVPLLLEENLLFFFDGEEALTEVSTRVDRARP